MDPSDYLGQAIGAPVTISSGFRTPQQNALVGGVPNSAHLTPGQAYDFVPKGISTAEAAQRLAKSGIPFDQIEDGGDHVHISFAPANRRQVISPKMDQSGLSDDDILALVAGKAPKASANDAGNYFPAGDSRNGPAAVTVSGGQAGLSDDEILSLVTGGAKAGTQGAPAGASKTQQPGMLQSSSAGVIQGARDVVSSFDPAAQWLDKHVGSITLGGLLPTADQAHANNLLARDQFNTQYGDNTAAAAGRAGGQIAASLPALAAGGEVLGPLAAGLGRAVPVAAPAMNFLAGTTKSNAILGAGGKVLQGATKGNKLLQLASKGTAGAMQGAEAAGLTSSASDQPLEDQLKQGAEFGGVLGAGVPAARAMGSATYNKLTGGGVSPALADLANQAVNKFGIPLRGSQISSSPFMHYLDSSVSKIPLSGMQAQNEAQRTAFSKAVAGTFGENADNLTPQVMSSARTRIGKVFDDVANKTPIWAPETTKLQSNLDQIVGAASQTLPEGSVTPLKNQVANIKDVIAKGGGVMPGDVYQALTRKGAPLDRAMGSTDPNIRYYASEIKNALDDSLQASAAPEDLAALKTARLQWKNMRTVQDLAAKAGIEGEISPALLLGAVKKSYKDMAYTGAGDIGKLADIGQQFLKEPPSSGTGERAALYSMLGAGAETAGEAMSNPEVILHRGAMLAGLLGTGRLIGGALKSHLYRDALLNSAAKSHGMFNNLFGNSQTIPSLTSRVAPYAIPSTVIGGNQLFNRAPVPSAP